MSKPVTPSPRATPTNWVPRLKLVLGKHGFGQVGPDLLIQRARTLGAKSIGVSDVDGRLGLSFDNLDAGALPQLTKGIDNWMALEYPAPYTLKLHVKTEELENPITNSVGAEMLLDLAAMGLNGALAGFMWVEPQNPNWVRQALVEVREAAGAARTAGARK